LCARPFAAAAGRLDPAGGQRPGDFAIAFAAGFARRRHVFHDVRGVFIGELAPCPAREICEPRRARPQPRIAETGDHIARAARNPFALRGECVAHNRERVLGPLRDLLGLVLGNGGENMDRERRRMRIVACDERHA
jgi:hypothetical protein